MNKQPEQARIGIIITLVFSGLLIGLVAGGFIAGNFLVDKSAGLAGGAMVLGYALLFSLGLGIAGGVAGKLLPRSKARLLAWIAAPIGLAILVLLAWRISDQQRKNRAALEAGYASLPPYEVHVTNFEKIDSFSYVYNDNMVRARIRNRTCTGPLPGKTRLALVTALRGVEGRTITCTDCDETSANVTWQILESKGDISSSEFRVSEKVMAEYPAVKLLLEAVDKASRKVDCQ